MKRTVLLLTAAAVAVTPLAASAAPPKPTKRTLTFDYTGFATYGIDGLSLSWDAPCTVVDACWDFSTVKGEKTIELAADDPSVGFQVWTGGDYAGSVVSFCGKGKITVSPKKAQEISVRPFLSDCGSIPTEGTLTAVITGTK